MISTNAYSKGLKIEFDYGDISYYRYLICAGASTVLIGDIDIEILQTEIAKAIEEDNKTFSLEEFVSTYMGCEDSTGDSVNVLSADVLKDLNITINEIIGYKVKAYKFRVCDSDVWHSDKYITGDIDGVKVIVNTATGEMSIVPEFVNRWNSVPKILAATHTCSVCGSDLLSTGECPNTECWSHDE